MDIEEALRAKRYEEPSILHFNMPPNQLMDSEYCEQLMSDMEARFGAQWEHLIAAPTLSCRLPELPGVYAFAWRPCFGFRTEEGMSSLRYIIYVGRAGEPGADATLKSRYANEYSKIVGSNPYAIYDALPSKASRDQLLNLYLNLHEIEFWYIPLNLPENLSYVKVYEKQLIKMMNPPCNWEFIRARISNKSQPAF